MKDPYPGALRGGSAIGDTVEESVSIDGPAGRLEGIFNYLPDATPREAVLALPPHPRLGGDLANNVVEAAARHLAVRGYPTLRFNYRGVGLSEGPFSGPLDSFRYWSEILEEDAYGGVLQDALAALQWLRRIAPTLHLVGYSFGAVLALNLAAGQRGIASAVTVALAVGNYRLDFLGNVAIPVLSIHSTDDFATSLETVEEKLRAVPESTLVTLEGTDHFFRGRENEVAALAGEFLDRRRAECTSEGGDR